MRLVSVVYNLFKVARWTSIEVASRRPIVSCPVIPTISSSSCEELPDGQVNNAFPIMTPLGSVLQQLGFDKLNEIQRG